MSTEAEVGQGKLFEVQATHLTLEDRFLVPPFSVLDARAGYWRDRKQDWLNLGIHGELASGQREVEVLERDEHLGLGEAGRSQNLLSTGTVRKGYGGDYDLTKGENAWGGSGTSVFDPVLCELLYRWFTPPGGTVLDPFAGGSVRGVVAAMLGRRYIGVDLRHEQVKANEAEAQRVLEPRGLELPAWYVGDSRQVLAGEQEGGPRADFVFSCPPYYDLEQYSDDPRDLSNAGTYEEFRAWHAEIIGLACALLRPNRYAAWVIGEVRGKDGAYLGLVPDTIAAFREAGLGLWNEALLLTAVGSLPIRVSAAFGKGRKLGKTHQNVLVFVKGDGRKAADECGPVAEVALEAGGATWRADGSATLGTERFEGLEPGT